MKATELRLGNIVYFTNPHSDRIVIELEEIKIDYDYFEPIPLTEEWLVKLGFILQDDGWYYKNGISFFDNDGWEIDGFDTTILYVHQLQNLYFALTGEELTINK